MDNLEKLRSTIYRTIDDINVWQDVLRLICEISGASKGLITLRDRLTAEIVIPQAVEEELQSPLIYGFSQQEVESYIGHFLEHDPWTEIEKLYHPSTPYALSTHIDSSCFINGPFGEWLEPQNIDDSIVVELGSSSHHWVAMNLYYFNSSESVKKKILKVLDELETLLQEVWHYGQLVRASQSQSSFLEYLLEQNTQPCFITEMTGEVVTLNSKAKIFLGKENRLRVNLAKKLVPSSLSSQQQMSASLQKLSQASFISDQSSKREDVLLEGDYFLRISPIFSLEDQLGSKNCLYLVKVISGEYDLSKLNQPIWNKEGLSRKERQLVELLANGKRVVDYQLKNNIAKSTAHYHWSNVKKKLNVKDKGEIFAKHQLFLKNL